MFLITNPCTFVDIFLFSLLRCLSHACLLNKTWLYPLFLAHLHPIEVDEFLLLTFLAEIIFTAPILIATSHYVAQSAETMRERVERKDACLEEIK